MVQATLAQNKRVTAEDHFQDTRHIILDFDEDLDYEAGDILEIRPENLPEDVDQFLKVMKWQAQADQVFEMKSMMRGKPCHTVAVRFEADWSCRTTFTLSLAGSDYLETTIYALSGHLLGTPAVFLRMAIIFYDIRIRD